MWYQSLLCFEMRLVHMLQIWPLAVYTFKNKGSDVQRIHGRQKQMSPGKNAPIARANHLPYISLQKGQVYIQDEW